MLRQYLAAAMERAHYELLQDSGAYYGELPDCPGAWAEEDTLEACRRELESVLEDWVLVRVARGMPLPEIGGVKLVVGTDEAA